MLSYLAYHFTLGARAPRPERFAAAAGKLEQPLESFLKAREARACTPKSSRFRSQPQPCQAGVEPWQRASLYFAGTLRKGNASLIR
jgi:hypothetical protein